MPKLRKALPGPFFQLRSSAALTCESIPPQLSQRTLSSVTRQSSEDGELVFVVSFLRKASIYYLRCQCRQGGERQGRVCGGEPS